MALAASAGDMGPSLGWEDPLRKWDLTPVFLPWKSPGQRTLAGYSSCGHKRVQHDLVTKNNNNICIKMYNWPPCDLVLLK